MLRQQPHLLHKRNQPVSAGVCSLAPWHIRARGGAGGARRGAPHVILVAVAVALPHGQQLRTLTAARRPQGPPNLPERRQRTLLRGSLVT